MAKIENFIQQIQAGSTTYDVAVKHGIQFKYGADGAVETANYWDGTDSAFTVVIPSVSDIIKSPVIFAGTVGSNGTITYVIGISATPTTGYLVYIQQDCTFDGKVCEAGDMAVYDGTSWRVIEGENQVAIVGANAQGIADVKLTGTAQEVLTVEGNSLKLSIDYSDIFTNVKVTKNATATLNVANGKVTVPSAYVGLSKANDSVGIDIAKAESINLPTALANGAVTINESVLVPGDFTWSAGTLPSVTMNAAKSFNASHSLSLSTATGSDFVTDVTALASAALETTTSGSAQITFVSGLSEGNGTSFVTGIRAATSTEESDLVVPGKPSVDSASNTFVYGLDTEAASGDLVSSITVGAVSITTGSGILTGTTKGGNSFIDSVTFGSVMEDSSKSWFVKGISSTGSDVVTDVSVGAVSLIADNNSTFANSAIVSASVSEHVLSFSTGSFMQPVALSKASDTITKGGLTKGGVKLDGFAQSSDTFTSGSLSQGTTSVSYKSLQTKAVSLTYGAASSYVFTSASSKTYSALNNYARLNTSNATPTKGKYILDGTSITVTIPADTYVSSFSAGTLPSWTVAASGSGSLTGSVGTALASSPYSWDGVDATKAAAVTIPGAYSLVSASDNGAIEVGAAGEYSVAAATVTIAAGEFVTDVYVGDSAAGVKSNS